MPSKRSVYPPCKDKRGNCFSLVNGKCRILDDTEFEKRNCPFYKTKEQYKKELKK